MFITISASAFIHQRFLPKSGLGEATDDYGNPVDGMNQFYSAEPDYDLNADHFKAKRFEHPVREHAVILDDEGYHPRTITIFEGEMLRLNVTSVLKNKHCLMVSDTQIFLSAAQGARTEGEHMFPKAGEYKIYCPSWKHKGKIVVLRKQSIEEKVMGVKPSRGIASEGQIIEEIEQTPSRPAYWMPKEY